MSEQPDLLKGAVAAPAPAAAPSPVGALSQSDTLKLLRTAAIVAAGAGLAHLIEGVPGLELPLDELITPVVIMALEGLRRLLNLAKI